MSIHTILGAGGAIADSLAGELAARHIPCRLVSRHPTAIDGATVLAADLTDSAQTLQAVAGSSVVYLCVGLKYDYRVWRRDWPRIFDNTIEACKRSGARLVFFDNVYMYGRTEGPMTEETPYDPSSRKGDLRARLATQLMSEVRKGNIAAAIARSADFYGPGTTKTSMPDLLVFQRLIKDKRAQWLLNADAPHSFTYVPDAARALAILAADDNSWNQVWHLPTAAPPITGRDLVRKAAAILQKDARCQVLPAWMIRLGGLFDRTTAELHEMLYQYAYDYRFDSSKFEKAYHFTPTPYDEGIRATVEWHLHRRG
ncbi:MAG TPA: NAD-dependent epimerase/dehydratase family protein [Puia sp.]|nr:NAD-dependent epimerase/dehydratase family protein [Puia sp.]